MSFAALGFLGASASNVGRRRTTSISNQNQNMPIFRAVNLPAPLIVQSIASVGLGLWLTFARRPPVVWNGWTMLAPSSPSPRTADTVSLLGIVVTGLEISYLVTSYMPFEENQFVAASVPVRLFLAGLMLAVCVVHRKRMSRSGFWELMGLAMMDAFAAIWLGNTLGRWDGMVRASF